VQPQPALGAGERGGAGIIGRPGFPPFGRPAVERQPAALASSPGAPAHLQALLGGEVASLVGGVDRLAALGAVVEAPGNQVAISSLAPAHRAHRSLPGRVASTSRRRATARWAAGRPWAARCGPEGVRRGPGHARKRLRPFSLDNVTAALPFIGAPRGVATRHRTHRTHRTG
jgi:hypothetical protein